MNRSMPSRFRGAPVLLTATAMLLLASWGCGGGISGGGGGGSGIVPIDNNPDPGDGSNQPDPIDDSNTNGNTGGDDGGDINGGDDPGDDPGADGSALRVRINGLPDEPVIEGQTLQLDATVTNQVGELVYEWFADPVDDAIIIGSFNTATLRIVGPGPLTVEVEVTDLETTETALDSARIIVATGPQPPPEAVLDILPVPPAVPGQMVTLQAFFSGPFPESMSWEQDFENHPLDPDVVIDLVDLGNGIATFTAPSLLRFTYTLHFRITGTFAGGGTLSDSVEVLIMGGPR